MIRALLLALLLIPTLLTAQKNGSKDIWAKARELMQQQRYAEAVTELRTLPRTADQLFWIAYSSVMMGELSVAEQHARDAVAMEERWPDSHVLLGDILHLRKKPIEALAEYQTAIAIKPANIDVLLKMGRIELALQRLSDAGAHFRGALSIDPANVYARLGLAELYTYQKKWDDARREYGALLKNGSNADVLIEAKVGLARVHAWTERFDDAVKLLQEVLTWKPETVIALELLAQVHEWRGEYTKAKRTYETILTWQPNHKEAKAKLVELQWVK